MLVDASQKLWSRVCVFVVVARVAQRRVRKVAQAEETCTRVDCGARRQKLEELASEVRACV
jgi:hypothetical protein